jgi:hypothetical protein
MARHFMSLITGSPVRWFILCFDPDPIDEGPLRKHVDDVLRLFFHAYGLARPWFRPKLRYE